MPCHLLTKFDRHGATGQHAIFVLVRRLQFRCSFLPRRVLFLAFLGVLSVLSLSVLVIFICCFRHFAVARRLFLDDVLPSSSNFGDVFVRCVPDTRFFSDLRVAMCVQWSYHEFVTKFAC